MRFIRNKPYEEEQMMNDDYVKKIFFYKSYELRTLEEYFEKMARRGLFIMDIKGYVFTFKKDKPRNYKYAIDMWVKLHRLETVPYENSMAHFQYCEECGWHRILRTSTMQVYYSEQENTVPFPRNDERLLEKINRKMKENAMIVALAYIVVALSSLAWYMIDVTSFITDSMRVARRIAALVMVGPCLIGAYRYRRFYHTNRERLKEGRGLLFGPYEKNCRECYAAGAVVIGCFAVVHRYTGVISSLLCGVAVAILIVWRVREIDWKEEFGRKAAIAGIAILAMVEIVVACTVVRNATNYLEKKRNENLEERQATMFASLEEYYVEDEFVETYYEYEVLNSRYPWILKKAMKQKSTGIFTDSEELPLDLLQRWGAAAGYITYSCDEVDDVILLYEDRLFVIDMDYDFDITYVDKVLEMAR